MPDEHSRKLLVLYLLGELTAGEELRLERHARRCPDCRKDLEELREVDALLRRWASRRARPGHRENGSAWRGP